jgi:hypothetical protein
LAAGLPLRNQIDNAKYYSIEEAKKIGLASAAR